MARRGDVLEEVKASLAGQKARVTCFAADLGSDAGRASLMAFLDQNLLKPDLLINNAGLGRGRDKLQDGDPLEWDEILDTNVKGLLYIDRAVLPQMVVRDAGHIVHIGSIAGQQAYAGGNVYCASKAAVIGLTKSVAIDYVAQGVRQHEL